MVTGKITYFRLVLIKANVKGWIGIKATANILSRNAVQFGVPLGRAFRYANSLLLSCYLLTILGKDVK